MRIELILEHLKLQFSLFLFLFFLLFEQILDGICHVVHAAGQVRKFIFVVILNTDVQVSVG